jgi:DNA-binding transcriptional ArsR family regulator
MPTVLRFGARDWARCRFVRSLLWETEHAARTLIDARQQRYHRTWLNTIDQHEAVRRLPLLLALNPIEGWVPDFLTPPAEAAAHNIEQELAAVARTPLRRVAAELRRSLDSRPTRARRAVLDELISHPATARRRVVAELRYAWTELLAPFWQPVRTLIDADLAYRADQVSGHGFGAVLAGLHPTISVTDTGLTIARGTDGTIELGGRGLALLPSAFVWPHLALIHEDPWPPTLVYPARGVGNLWAERPQPPAALAGALGRTRALLLDDLDHPVTTTALAARNTLSMPTTSGQLRRLQAAGLISGQRIGKEVRYRRTTLGENLIRANRPTKRDRLHSDDPANAPRIPPS